MKLRLLVVLLVAVLIVQQTRACAPASSCARAGSKRAVNKTVERVEVTDVEEAQWRGACHSLCITNEFPDHTQTTSLISWPAILQVDQRCRRMSSYVHCVESCISRRFDTSLSTRQCQTDCNNGCNATCFGLDACRISGTCDLTCGVGGCRSGCRISRQLMVSEDQLPAAPVNSDITLLTTATGSFLLDVRNTQPTNANLSSSVHSFVVRMDGDNITKYWWMRNFEVTELDLAEFVCKEVSISFAVISEHGVSDFSPNKRFCIEGANSTLQPPNSVNVVFEEITEDPRIRGLFTVNISWTHPIDLILAEVQYRVIITAQSCDKTVEITLPSNTTSVSEPGFDPDCDQVRVMVYTLLNGIGSSPNTTEIALQNPPINFAIDHMVNADVFSGINNVTVYISLLRRDPLLLARINGFRILLFYVGQSLPPENEEVNIVENKFNYSINFMLTPETTVTLTIIPIPAFDLRHRGSVVAPGQMNFVFRGLPPSTINNIDIVNVTVDVATSTIALNITWEPPSYPYGELRDYQLLLTGEFNGTTNYTFGGQRFLANATSGSVNASVSLEVETYLLQLYSRNMISTSQPSFLSFNLSDYYNDMNEIVTNLPVTSEDSIPNYAYYIIGIGSAVLLIILTLVTCCFVYTCYVKHNNAIVDLPITEDPWKHLYSENGSTSFLERPSIVADAWEISPNDVLIGKALGSGFFGEVYRCSIQGPITTPYTERNQLNRSIRLPAAVKILKENATEKMHSDFIKEIELMKRTGDKYNSHVVSMICCTVNQEPKALVLEYVEHGDLLQYLQKNKVFVIKNKMNGEPIDSNKALPNLESADQYSGLAPSSVSSPYVNLRNVLMNTESVVEDPYPDLKQLLPVDMVTFAYEIADGMEYLSSLGIIHRDLACRNILVGTSKVLKISDFGLARQLSDKLVYYRSTEGKLPIRWMAPEAIQDRTFNTSTDIWSYGVTLWEICTLGAFPYPLLSNNDVLDAILNGQRLEKPPNCTEDLYEIMLHCWKEDPESRPSFSSLKCKAEQMIQQANQDYPYLHFNLNDYLPYCALRLTTEAVSTENILEEYNRGEDNEKESSGSSEVEEETKNGSEVEKESNPTDV